MTLPAIAALALVLSCSPQPTARPNRPASEAAMQAAAAGINGLAASLFGELGKEAGNLAFSPFSIATALAMAGAGASDASATEMSKVLGLALDNPEAHAGVGQLAWMVQQSTDVKMRVANRVYVKHALTLAEPFVATMKEAYAVPIQPVDFGAEATRLDINAWVEQQTDNKIKQLIPAGVLDKETRLVLVNAIYFLGKWEEAFPKSATQPAPFFTAPDEQKDVPMMADTRRLSYAGLGDAELVVLPYRGGSFSMSLLIPKAIDGLPALEKRFSAALLTPSVVEKQIDFAMPRFRVESTSSLGPALSTAGMPTPFECSDVGRLNNLAPNLCISAVLHKAFVDVTEEGTEAAAASAVTIMLTSLPPKIHVVRADRPFLFAITHQESGAILFLGRVADPHPSPSGQPD